MAGTKYFLYPFGISGDLVAIPDATQVSGSVSYQQGFGLDYQKDLATDPTAKPVPRSQSNQLYYDITTNIQQYQQHGVPEFIQASQNLGVPFPYSKYAVVRYDDSGVGTNYKNYVSLTDSNNTVPPGANWQLLDPAADKVPVGTLLDFAGTAAPTGYLGCDGSAVSRTTYATLFGVVGTIWGAGDGSTTFNLPDFRRHVAVGSGGTATAVLGNTVGSTGGEEAHAQTIAEMAAHKHDVVNSANGSLGSGANGQYILGVQDAVGGTTFSNVGLQGSGTAANIMQPSAVVLKIIKI